jgi:hypothetical protein
MRPAAPPPTSKKRTVEYPAAGVQVELPLNVSTQSLPVTEIETLPGVPKVSLHAAVVIEADAIGAATGWSRDANKVPARTVKEALLLRDIPAV